MGVDWLYYAYLAVMIAFAAYSYYAMSKAQKNNQTDMSPTGLEAFSITKCEEGSVVPMVYGKVRLPGNILWYGNLVTEEIMSDSGGGGGKGGGGGGGESVVTGYKYYLDVWQSICTGPISIVKTYINGKELTVPAQEIVFNNGTQDTVPTKSISKEIGIGDDVQTIFPGDLGPNVLVNEVTIQYQIGGTVYYAYDNGIGGITGSFISSGSINYSTGALSITFSSPPKNHKYIIATYVTSLLPNFNGLKGVAWVFYNKWFLGENVSFLPTIHFIVQKNSNTGLPYENLSNGTNPAAIIYDLMTKAGEFPTNINLASFQAASTYWNTRAYGLNLIFSRQENVGDMAQKVLNWVDGMLYMDYEGKHFIKAFNPSESPVDILVKEDFKEFSFTRPSYEDLPNDLRATYMDEDFAYSDRVVKCPNPALQRIVQRKTPISIDLKCFRDVATASKRLYEIMKRETYPGARMDFKTNLKFSYLKKGDIVTISHSDYGITSIKTRILSASHETIDKNELSFQSIQVIEDMFDDVFKQSGGINWTDPDWASIVLTKNNVFELPYNPHTKRNQAFLLLASREKSVETYFSVYYSNDNADYLFQQNCSTFSQYGLLDEEYPDTTKSVDDSEGIVFSPYLEDPHFDSVSRTDLFSRWRFALLDMQEVVAFQTVIPYGASSFKLEGIIRGLFHTPVLTHTTGKSIWLFNISDNIFYGRGASSFYMKYVPSGVNISSVTALNITVTDKAKKPYPTGRIKAARSGSAITITLWPNTQEELGAGLLSADSQTDQWPPAYSGDFQAQIGAGTPWYESSYTFNYTQAGSHTLGIKHRINGYLSAVKQIIIGASDGDYYA